MNLIDSSIV